MAYRALGVYLFGLMAVQLGLMVRDVTHIPGYSAVVPLWSSIALGAAMVAIALGAIELILGRGMNQKALTVGLVLLWTVILADFLVSG